MAEGKADLTIIVGPSGHFGARCRVRRQDGGRAFVMLHTDLANPVSNRIYERIGYRRVAEVEMLVPDPARA